MEICGHLIKKKDGTGRVLPCIKPKGHKGAQHVDAEARKAHLEADRKWKERNPGKRREVYTTYVDKNREAVNTRNKAWNRSNPARILAAVHRRHARLRGAISEPYSDGAVLAMTDSRCWLCGKSWEGVPRGYRTWHVDHVIPLSSDASFDCLGNVRVACRGCNQTKSFSLPSADVIEEVLRDVEELRGA